MYTQTSTTGGEKLYCEEGGGRRRRRVVVVVRWVLESGSMEENNWETESLTMRSARPAPNHVNTKSFPRFLLPLDAGRLLAIERPASCPTLKSLCEPPGRPR